jgi:hypothetical protein
MQRNGQSPAKYLGEKGKQLSEKIDALQIPSASREEDRLEERFERYLPDLGVYRQDCLFSYKIGAKDISRFHGDSLGGRCIRRQSMIF